MFKNAQTIVSVTPTPVPVPEDPLDPENPASVAEWADYEELLEPYYDDLHDYVKGYVASIDGVPQDEDPLFLINNLGFGLWDLGTGAENSVEAWGKFESYKLGVFWADKGIDRGIGDPFYDAYTYAETTYNPKSGLYDMQTKRGAISAHFFPVTIERGREALAQMEPEEDLPGEPIAMTVTKAQSIDPAYEGRHSLLVGDAAWFWGHTHHWRANHTYHQYQEPTYLTFNRDDYYTTRTQEREDGNISADGKFLADGDQIANLWSTATGAAGAGPTGLSAYITTAADGDHSNGNMPGKILFGAAGEGEAGWETPPAMVINRKGYVGIGVGREPFDAQHLNYDPNYKLHLHEEKSGSIGPIVQLTRESTGNGASDGAAFGLLGEDLVLVNSESSRSISFFTEATDLAQTQLKITAAGNVGVNQNTPAERLDVVGNIKADGDIIVTGTVDGVDIAARDHDKVTLTGAGGYLSIGSTPSQVITASKIDLASSSHVTGTLPLTSGGTNNTASYSEGALIFADSTKLTENSSKLKWDISNHRLGLGTSSPAETLHVKGGGNSQTTLESASGSGGLTFQPSAGDKWLMGGLTDSTFRLYNIDEAKTRLSIDGATGNAGLGSASPTSSLVLYNHDDEATHVASFVNADTGDSTSDGFRIGISDTEQAIINFKESGGIRILSDNQDVMHFDANRNVIIGSSTVAAGSSADKNLVFEAGTEPSSNPSDTVHLFARLESGVAELRVEDESGNGTTLSTHNRDLLPEPPAEVSIPWTLRTYNRYIGKVQNVDMAAVVKDLEAVTGKRYIYEESLPAEDRRDWMANQLAEKTRVEAARLALAMEEEIECPKEEALETFERKTRTMVPVTKTRYDLDEATGETIARQYETEEPAEVPTGQVGWRLKAGARLDPETGKFYRRKTAEECVIEPYVIKQPPQWVVERMAANAQP